MTGHEPINLFLAYLGEDGTRAHKYWNFSGAWCCGEVAMVMKQTTGNLFYDGKKVVYCPTAYAWCKTHLQKIPTRNAQYGDIIFFDWNRNGQSDHIGMVEYVEGTTVHTIEGNTGSPARVRRKVRASYIHGIFRPKYEPAKPEDYLVQVDGEWGYHTCLGTQYVLSCTPLDGVLGKATVKAIQKKVGTKVDGGWGSDTTLAMQKFLNANGITDMNGNKLVEDGEKGKNTISAWQKWINAQIKGEDPTPEPTGYTGAFPDFVTHSRNFLHQTAKSLAWAKGTAAAKYNYKTGSATEKFTAALNKVFPNRSSWGAKAKKGSSCDVFVATVLRFCGCDTTWPRGLAEQFGKTPKHMSQVSSIAEADMIYYSKKSGGGHTRLIVPIGSERYNCEANHDYKGGLYGHIGSKSAKPSSTKMLKMFKVTSAFRNFMAEGDEGSEVLKMQKFLNWYGYNLTEDGGYGPKCKEAVMDFQTNNGLTVDGEWGPACNAKAKEIKK